ncbi:MAG: type II secretion system F family protein [Acidimicrobiia bacterium]|nr:type II secretion system F family protein [Acidimicrobiia bacterium]
MASSTFTYKVRDKNGAIVSGEIEGASTAVVAKALRERGMIPLQVEEKQSSILQTEIKIPGLAKRVKQREIVIFSRQFATMVNSGLSLIRALSVLEEQTESVPFREVLSKVRTDVERGTSLSAAMDRHPKVFTDLYISMIRAGEIGGVLDETLLRLADILEAQMNLRSKIRSAMAYPAVIGLLIVAVTTAMIVFVVPVFTNLYAELGDAELPFATKLLVGLSNVLTSYWWLVMALTGLAIWGFRRWITTEQGRLHWDTIKLKLPVFGKLAHKTALSRFSRTLAVLSRTGVPILQAIDIVADTSGNQLVAKALDEVKESVRSGESLAQPLSRHSVFPPMIVQMMTVGEETGELDGMLAKVADFYEREVEDTVSALTSLIEPLLIVVMGISVGAILISLYLPIFNIAGLVS